MPDIASFMSMGLSDWAQHIALTCYRYNIEPCDATGMTPFRAMFGVLAFEAYGDLYIAGADDAPNYFAPTLSLLHKLLVTDAQRSGTRDCRVLPV